MVTHCAATTGWLVVAAGGGVMALFNMSTASAWFFIGLTVTIVGTLLAVLVLILRRTNVGDDALRDVFDIAYAQGYHDGQSDRPFAQVVDRPRCQSGRSLRSILQ